MAKGNSIKTEKPKSPLGDLGVDFLAKLEGCDEESC